MRSYESKRGGGGNGVGKQQKGVIKKIQQRPAGT